MSQFCIAVPDTPSAYQLERFKVNHCVDWSLLTLRSILFPSLICPMSQESDLATGVSQWESLARWEGREVIYFPLLPALAPWFWKQLLLSVTNSSYQPSAWLSFHWALGTLFPPFVSSTLELGPALCYCTFLSSTLWIPSILPLPL